MLEIEWKPVIASLYFHPGYTAQRVFHSFYHCTFCRSQVNAAYTKHWTLSAPELGCDSFPASLNGGPDSVASIGQCMSPWIQPFNTGRAVVLANAVTSLPAATGWHGDPCIIGDTLVHLQSRAKDLGAMILCQWFCRRARLLITPVAPLSTTQTSPGVKGTAGGADGTRLDSEERKWESTRGYSLHIIHSQMEKK